MQVAKAKMYIVSCIPINFQGNMLVSVTDNSTSTLFFWCVHLCSFLYTSIEHWYTRTRLQRLSWEHRRVIRHGREYLWCLNRGFKGPSMPGGTQPATKVLSWQKMCLKNNKKVLKLIFFFWKKCKAVYKNSDLLISSSGYCTLSGCLATHNPATSSFVLFLLYFLESQKFSDGLCQVLFIYSVILRTEHLNI